MTKVVVRVLDMEDDHKVVKELGPMSGAKADKVEGGLLINMNTERYCVVQQRVDHHGNDL